jgi:hypothetical protein
MTDVDADALAALAAAARDARRWLAGCMAAGADPAQPGAPRDLAALAMALRRLIDAERALEAWERQRSEPATKDPDEDLGEDRDAQQSRIERLLDRLDAGGAPASAEDEGRDGEP